HADGEGIRVLADQADDKDGQAQGLRALQGQEIRGIEKTGLIFTTKILCENQKVRFLSSFSKTNCKTNVYSNKCKRLFQLI
ncbi:MAG: hypothetical protein IJ194_01935, partial [Bacilli bacterium]|nr:hypothetical protein [Bacilli bacterium]